jgi:hypothetical protein
MSQSRSESEWAWMQVGSYKMGGYAIGPMRYAGVDMPIPASHRGQSSQFTGQSSQ